MKKLDLMIVLLVGLIAATILTSCFPVRPASSIRYCPPVRGSR
jgi:hypothetical protein